MTSAFSAEWTVAKPAVRGRKGMVAAQNQKAAAVGVAVLEAGGNAVDAAIATGFALGAVEPWMSGLGGGGAMLVRTAGGDDVRAVDFGMVAPRALDPADYPLSGAEGADLFGWPGVVEDRNLRGPLAVCTPTWLAGVALAHERFGRLPWRELVTPAVALAREGLAVDWYAALVIGSAARELAASPAARAVWLPDGFVPYPDWIGSEPRLVLHGLAATLEAIAAEGAAAVYSGEVGRRLVADLAEQGGRLALDDLASVRATVRDALRIPRGAATLFAMPGLYAGTTLARCIELLGDAPEPRDFAEVLRRAYAERLANLGDSGDGGGAPPACTSHLCTVDRDGMTVALTQTLLSLFGSKVVSPSTGMLLNNGVMWFDPRPGRPNSLAAGKRPLANMCPVIGQDGGRWLALGASGGRKILPAVLQLACAIVDRGLDLGAAFAAPRIDASGGALVVADARLPAAVRADLAARFPLRETTAMVYPLSFACPSAVLRDEATGEVWGAAEPVQPWAGARAEP